MEILKVHLGCICFTVIMFSLLLFLVIIPLYKVICSQAEFINRLYKYRELYLDEHFLPKEN